MSEILRVLQDGLFIFARNEKGFGNDLINNILSSDPNVMFMHFLEKEERKINTFIQKQVMVPAHIQGEFKVTKYMGINFQFDLDESLLENETVKDILKSINVYDSGFREFIGVIKGGKGTMFFTY